MEADINSILIGYRGKFNMLKICFGSGEEDKPDKPRPKATAKSLKSFAKSHNASFKSVSRR